MVGAYRDDIVANDGQGSAYVFVRPGGGWTNMNETAKLTASDGAAFDFFGWSVGISGDMIVVGALGVDLVFDSDEGSAYVFQDQQEIPTLSEWGMIIFMVLAGVGAVYYLRRQRI